MKNMELNKLFKKALKAVKEDKAKRTARSHRAIGASIAKVKRAHTSGDIISTRSSIPSNSQYEQNELRLAMHEEDKVNKAPLSERKEAAAEYLDAIANRPAQFAERVDWIIAGNYGQGPYLRAKQILSAPRMNQKAGLAQLAAVYEYKCPTVMARAAWHKLSGAQKAALDRELDKVIRDAHAE